MYVPLVNYDELLNVLLVLLSVLIGYRTGRLAHQRSRDRIRRSARRILWIVGLAVLVVAVKLVVLGLLWSFGWDFVENRVLVSIPLLLVPASAALVLTVPRFHRLASKPVVEPIDRIDAGDRSVAADPVLVMPAQATAVGATLAWWAVAVAIPVPSYLDDVGLFGGLLLAATVLLWLRQRRRQRELGALSTGRPDSSIPVRVLRAAGVLVAVVAIATVGFTAAASASRLPDRISMAEHQNLDFGGGPAGGHSPAHGTSVTELTGPRDGVADARFTLTAAARQIQLSSGAVVDALTFNGQAPGPELRVRQGDLVEATLVNNLPRETVSVHWHGYDVPNAEDGAPGVTQNAVPPGGSHTYRFVAKQAGSFWYHTHQNSAEMIAAGLFGALIVLPRDAPDLGADLTMMSHAWTTTDGQASAAFGTSDNVERHTVAPGTPVRLRVVNTSIEDTSDLASTTLALVGAPFRVAAIDGVDLNAPSELVDTRIQIANGGRHDLTFTMPDHPVTLANVDHPGVGLLLSPDGTGAPPPIPADAPLLDPANYGTPTTTPFNADSRFDRSFTQILDDGPRFNDGKLTLIAPTVYEAFSRLFAGESELAPMVNGALFPNIPTLAVREGDLVKVTFVNRSHELHPMHPHGHQVLVLSRNGRPVSGSPWWTDTLDIRPGESYEVAFQADNPGVWMDHCHNLDHAGEGMVLHLAYEGVTTPFEVGSVTPNRVVE